MTWRTILIRGQVSVDVLSLAAGIAGLIAVGAGASLFLVGAVPYCATSTAYAVGLPLIAVLLHGIRRGGGARIASVPTLAVIWLFAVFSAARAISCRL